MLAPEAWRLITVEVLRPTASLTSGVFPTVAGRLVYDSREIAVQDISTERPYTPVLALHSSTAALKPRGEPAALDDLEHEAVLDIVAELAVVAGDEAGAYADALAGTDPNARLVLAALCSKVRFLLERSSSGAPWRKLVKRIVSVEAIPFAIPDLGWRYQRTTLRYTVELAADVFNVEEGGLPEPIRSVFNSLPAESYAKAKLAELAGYFSAESVEKLEEIAGSVSGPGGVTVQVGRNDLNSTP